MCRGRQSELAEDEVELVTSIGPLSLLQQIITLASAAREADVRSSRDWGSSTGALRSCDLSLRASRSL